MKREVAEEIYEEMHEIFRAHKLDPVPCGYSLGGRGLWYYEFHMNAGHYNECKPPMSKVLKECTELFEVRQIPLDGSGFSWVGDGWWFMHFIVIDYKPGIMRRLRERANARLTNTAFALQHWLAYRKKDKLDNPLKK
jgi:hypothetical protein